MSKVYCNSCRYQRTYSSLCLAASYEKDTPYERILCHEDINEKNKNNDCESYEPEPPVIEWWQQIANWFKRKK